jgi:hypothetical protein
MKTNRYVKSKQGRTGAGVLELEVLVLELGSVDGLASGSVVVGEVTTLAYANRVLKWLLSHHPRVCKQGVKTGLLSHHPSVCKQCVKNRLISHNPIVCKPC